MQKSPGLKPDWLTEVKALSRKILSIVLYKSRSKTLLKIGSKGTDDSF